MAKTSLFFKNRGKFEKNRVENSILCSYFDLFFCEMRQVKVPQTAAVSE